MGHTTRFAAVATLMCLPLFADGQLACPRRAGAEIQTERFPAPGELTTSVETYATDGIPGYTTYRLAVELSRTGTLQNVYTIAGSDFNPMHFPAAYQVDAPFGANTGGTKPQYWNYNAQCQYDSWLTVGVTDGSDDLGNIGIDFDQWTEDNAMDIDDGAVFWMSPSDAVSSLSDSHSFIIAQFTIRTETTWSMTVGEMQGRSYGWDLKGDSYVEDWRSDCNTWTNGDLPEPGTTCPLTADTMEGSIQEINDNCCNGGSGGGHRRAQACDLSVCTAACAAIFLPIVDTCKGGAYGAFVASIPEADSLAANCRKLK